MHIGLIYFVVKLLFYSFSDYQNMNLEHETASTKINAKKTKQSGALTLKY
jgi:hypothetical protein